MSGPDVLVVGAGPAGLAAAREVAAAGLEVVLVDENQRPGGQIRRRRFLPLAGSEPASLAPVGLAPRLDFWPRTLCGGLTGPGTALLVSPDGRREVSARAVVVATGGLERVHPVPGWTLPGVMTAGASQTYLKGSGFLPYRRVVVAGSGPLLLAAAAQLVEAGVEVALVAEAARGRDLAPASALRTLAAPGVLFREGGSYAATLLRARVPFLTGTGVSGIDGDTQVEGARLRPLAADWSYADGPERRVACDAVLLSHGFGSSTELVAQAGAELVRDVRRLTWRPRRDRSFRTTVPGLVAVGDCAGVGGVHVAELEGRLAGAALARDLGGTARTAGHRVERARRRRLARLETFRRGMDEIFRPGAGAVDWARPETCVCRCEDTTRGEVDRALDRGITDPHALKLWTRAGMGSCQGRVCAPYLDDLLAVRHGEGTRRAPSAQLPVRPLPAGLLAAGDDPDEAVR